MHALLQSNPTETVQHAGYVFQLAAINPCVSNLNIDLFFDVCKKNVLHQRDLEACNKTFSVSCMMCSFLFKN